MKEIFFIVLTLTIFSFPIEAQVYVPKHEVRLSISDGLPLSIGMALGNVFGSVFTNRKILDSSDIGHWSVGYRNHVSNRIAVGGDVTFQSLKYNFEHKDGSQSNQHLNYVSVMPAFELTYYRSNMVRFYGSAMAGVGILNTETIRSDSEIEDDNSSAVTFAFQLNPLALRVGRQVAGFAELGVGTKGFITLGLSAAF